jgi:thioester reductase-like protein
MLRDAALPEDIRPRPSAARRRDHVGRGLCDARTVLITGTTGFLGGWLAAELLRTSNATLVCLVRPGREGASARLRSRLIACGVEPAQFDSRVRVVEGDLSAPLLGLSSEAISLLVCQIDAICHAGATVNWVGTYRSLRSANVLGTSELLRLACMCGCPFHFVSSLSTCYSTSGPASVDETHNALGHLAGVHLGYAQSKVIAEALVTEAGQRGLPVTIYRPSLIAGHSATGDFNGDDLLSLLVKGCVHMGCAPDLDWTLDALPVDVVSREILRSSALRGNVHLLHPRPRHWRECVLWMRLYGYDLTLLPYHAWLRRLQTGLALAASSGERHPLAPLERLLFDRPEVAGGFTIPELYEDSRRSHAGSSRSTTTDCPDLDAHLLHHYFETFISAHHVPPPPQRTTLVDVAAGTARETTQFDTRFFARALAGRDVTVERVNPLDRGSAESILSELTAWRSPQPTGLFRYLLDLNEQGTRSQRPVVLKVKARDKDAIAVGEALSALCDARIGAAYARWSERLGLSQSHVRELAIYRQSDPRFTRHAPALLGSVCDERRSLWALLLEQMTDVALKDTVNTPESWTPAAISTAVAGLSELHAIWYNRRLDLVRQPWIGCVHSADAAVEMTDLWEALAQHARASFCGWTDPSMWAIHRLLIARIPQWWPVLESQTPTLIHNDFNPRNVCLKTTEHGLRLCAYDWELATIGAPQRDLAEFLCFVLTANSPDDHIDHWVEQHRRSLEVETGARIDPASWRAGFAAALYDVLISRLTMYALIDRVRRQPFLPRVVRTWRRLYERYPLVQES